MNQARELGRVVGERPGATHVVVAAIHGNEPAGLEAAQRVLKAVDPKELRGELVVLFGNRAALERGVRYQRHDLNRAWHDEGIVAVRKLETRTDEAHEQYEILVAIDAAMARARGPMHLADLHTSSAPGIPFMMIANDDAHRAFVRDFGVVALLGLERHIGGVLSQYMSGRGFVAFAAEGGQHRDPASVDALEAIVWQSLRAAGQLDEPSGHERIASSRAWLERVRGELPTLLEVASRHAITPEDRFVMEPGFRNIHRAAKGQLLARDARGEIRATEDGLVILPLYQGLGSDGFFWGRELPA